MNLQIEQGNRVEESLDLERMRLESIEGGLNFIQND